MADFITTNLLDAIELNRQAGRFESRHQADKLRREAVELLRMVADRLEETYTTTHVPEGRQGLKPTKCPGVPSGRLPGERRCVESGEIITRNDQCEDHAGRTV